MFEYKACSNKLVGSYEADDYHIRVFTQKEKESSTFEYDLLLVNPFNQELITESMSNKDEIRTIMELAEDESSVEEVLAVMNDNKFKENLKQDIDNSDLDDLELIKHIIAARYLDSTSKAEAAQEIAFKLVTDDVKIEIPEYIKEAIQWIYPEQKS